MENEVVDSSSIEVDRRQRRAKTDRLDVKKLLKMLVRYHQGERDVWRVVRVPSVAEEDARQLHRELGTLQHEKTSHSNRIKGLLSSCGATVVVDRRLPKRLKELRLWDGSPLPADLHARLLREFGRMQAVNRQIRSLEQEFRGTEFQGGDTKLLWRARMSVVGLHSRTDSPENAATAYDADGEVTSVVDPGGASYQYVYDQDGRVIRTRMAPADLEQPAANQSNATLGQGNNGGSDNWSGSGSSPCNVYPFSLSIGDVLQMSVTATGFVPTLVLLRPSGVLTASNGFYVSATSGNTLALTFTADAAGTWDVLVSSTPGSHGTFSFTCQVDPVLPTAMLETDNTYDADGNLTQVTDLVGQQTVYQYDAVGDLTRATQGTVSGGIYTVDHRADFTYNADGSLATITRYLGDGTLTAVTSTYGYNDAGQLTSLVHAHDGSALASYAWGYDLAGNMTSQQSTGSDYFTEDGSGDVTGEAAEQGSSTYTYDHANQQTSESDNYPNDYSLGENYAYDGNGNRSGCTTGAGNELTFDGTYTYTYDADGNCTAKFIDVHGTGVLAAGDTDVTLYSWDYANRLVQAQLENVYGTVTETIKYTYDYQNRRIEEIVTPAGAGSQYSYLAYQGDQPYAQFSGQVSGSSFAETDLFLAAPTVDQVLADWQNEGTVAKPAWQVNWLLPDQEGTIRDLAAYITVCGSGPTGMASTFVLTHRDYDSFGNLVQTDYNVAPAINTIIGYSGGIYDANLNLVQFVDRWYDPNTGRFLSPDPTGFAGGLSNLYCYCGNNPLTQTDPTGDQQGYAGSGVVFAAGYNQAPISLTESCPSCGVKPVHVEPDVVHHRGAVADDQFWIGSQRPSQRRRP